MKPWHSLSLCAKIIDTSCDLHSSVCLAMLSRILLIAFILAWSKSFSAFLIILFIPYTQGLCESIKKICGRYGIQTHFKGGRTIKNLLVSPKDKDPMVNPKWCHLLVPMWGPRLWWWIHRGTSRTFGERYKEHLKPPSAIHHHSNQTGHTTNQNNFQIIGREGHNLARNIKESIYIRVNNPTLNNNIGKFNLSHIWDRVLLKTKGLTLNNHSNNNNNQLTNPH